jgi:chorismate mutase-like protein
MRGLKIGDWRTKIDAIDTTLLHLLNVRAAFALEVGKLKGEAGMLLRVPARENEILSRMKKLNPGPLDSEAVEKIYQLILDESIRIQESYGYGTAAAGFKSNQAQASAEQPRTAQARVKRRKRSVA